MRIDGNPSILIDGLVTRLIETVQGMSLGEFSLCETS
jgi:hypothetical protein